MSRYIKVEDWIPVDNFSLEANALAAVKSNCNHIVVAGPGAGKTELLAQRACYLLQTNLCKNPQKILAISFKRDAAFNLAERVEKRVGKQLAKRFTSLTFDAFSKNLVDRFRQGLPDNYRPNASYKIETHPTPKSILNLFEVLKPGITTRGSYAAKRENKHKCMKSLSNEKYPLHSSEQLPIGVLNAMFKHNEEPLMTFSILSRLAQLLLDKNPIITDYLRQTYSYVFLDEFQDATTKQYELIKAAFLNSDCILTAVGDTKQRIMLWAGAMNNIFAHFEHDFSATKLSLLMNFRSAPRLVELQNYLTEELMGSTTKCTPREDLDENSGVAEFYIFSDFEQEAKILAEQIHDKIVTDGTDPREICLLFKQTPEKQATELKAKLKELNIKSRIENELQDLLVEPIVQFLINFIYSAISKDARNERIKTLQEYEKFYQIYDDKGALTLEREIVKKLKKFGKFSVGTTAWGQIEASIWTEIQQISFAVFSSYYPQYSEETYFDLCIEKFLGLIRKEYDLSNDLLSSLNTVSGEDCVPIMTIHKSKGLEFSIVYFIGFEAQNFWNFENQPDEDTCAFFVALSRAKEEVYFTFCHQRNNKWGALEQRTIDGIMPLISALNNSQLVEGKDFTTQ